MCVHFCGDCDVFVEGDLCIYIYIYVYVHEYVHVYNIYICGYGCACVHMCMLYVWVVG